MLYVVATPIGNRGDISPRAVEILRSVALIAAEDTRHSGPLLRDLGIRTPLRAMHEHNERQLLQGLLRRLQQGDSLALISDAGTPLISDPGFPLVRECHRHGIRVSPVPGPSAAICALSAAGLPSDRFLFEGFPPRSQSARRDRFEGLQRQTATLIFYESSHRIEPCLADMVRGFGSRRPAVLARELTKRHETIRLSTLGELLEWVRSDDDQRRGEFVVLVAGAEPAVHGEVSEEAERVLTILLQELPVKQAVALTARITGEKKNPLYQRALKRGGGR